MKIQKLLTLFIIISSFALAGCPKKAAINEDGSGAGGPVTDEQINAGGSDSDSGNAMGMQTIHFPYDSFEVVGENKEILKNNVKILKDNATLNIQIEGHCDERGGVQYNLALGEKRANAVKQQVLAGGVAGSRVTTISMGKEKPIAQGGGEDAWAKNRRANFVITSK
ncbi:MAG TPA: OmpA family protein [Bdellovibrionota bacterium]|jgi:peptidoglycan-associated lipoprotein